MLAKYLTRFGDIKPRKYTDNNISTQKKVREAIVRSRELGLLDYIRS
jgi:ribosomal protein S18